MLVVSYASLDKLQRTAFCKMRKLVAAGFSLRVVLSIFIMPYAT